MIEEVKIELTNYCKRNCVHCSSDANTKHLVELALEDVKRIVDECSRLKVSSIVLTGGEATEYQNMEEVITYIRKKGISIIKLYTMCEPTDEKYQVLKRLTELGLTEVIYSLTIPLTRDGAVTYDNIIEFLIKVSQINQLSFHYCLTTKTVGELSKIDEILSKIGIQNFKSFSFLRYVEHGRGKDDLVLSSRELKQLKPILISFMNHYHDKIHFGSPFNILNLTNIPCTAGSKTMIIGFDGNVYPCDAMKYFDYLGSGGNIYSSTLEDIYYSSYFKKIRKASHQMNEECSSCSFSYCKGGCLAQKMLEIIKKGEDGITVRWYQENALRTMNEFGSRELLKLNAYTGIIGEYGEFFDYIKKLYTHHLSEDKKQEIRMLAPRELGDLVWYLSTSLALFYDYTLDEVYEVLFKKKNSSYQVDEDLIERASFSKDPLCFWGHDEFSYTVDSIEPFLKKEYLSQELNEQNVFQMLLQFKKVLNRLDYIETKEEAKEVVVDILIEVASISRSLFSKSFSEILSDNIEKLRIRYPEGFDFEVANLRIGANKKYKEEECLISKKKSRSIVKK